MKYSSTFTERNAEALGRVIKQTLQFIADSDPAVQSPEDNSGMHVIGKIDIVKVPADQVAG